MRISGSHFEGALSFRYAALAGGLSLLYTDVGGTVDLSFAQLNPGEFGSCLVWDHGHGGGLILDGGRFGGSVNLHPLVLNGDLSAVDARIQGRLNLGIRQVLAEERDRMSIPALASMSPTFIGGAAQFVRAIFEGDVYFERAVIHGVASFDRARFMAAADFRSARFSEAIFAAAIFGETLNLAGATFKSPPSFVGVDPKALLVLPTKGSIENGPSADPAERWRALKHLASSQQNVEAELEFNARELQARTQHPGESRYYAYLVNLYALTSDFGQSIGRPIGLWLLGAVLLFAVALQRPLFPFWLAPQAKLCQIQPNCPTESDRAKAALVYTLRFALALPVGGGDAETAKQVSQILWLDRHPPLAMTITTAFHSAFSAVMLFLALLAIRNRFRMR
jgi:hypothetical protein